MKKLRVKKYPIQGIFRGKREKSEDKQDFYDLKNNLHGLKGICSNAERIQIVLDAMGRWAVLKPGIADTVLYS